MCSNVAKCAICTDLGKDNTHRVGSAKCEGVKAGPPERAVESVRRTSSGIDE